MAVLAHRLRRADHRQLELALGDSVGRVCSRLVELSQHWAAPITVLRPDGTQAGDENDIQFSLPLTQTELAAWTGLSREAVVKALHKLRALGWIENKGTTFLIHDIDALRHRGGR